MAVDVGHVFAHRCTVRCHEHAIERPCGREPRVEERHELGIGLSSQHTAGERPRGENRHGLQPCRLEPGKEAAHFVVRVGECITHGLASYEQVTAKVVERGALCEEGV